MHTSVHEDETIVMARGQLCKTSERIETRNLVLNSDFAQTIREELRKVGPTTFS